MMRQADSVLLLAILYLASTLATVQAIQYVGPKEPVPEGQPWRITCYNPPGNKVAWKKNEQDIPQLNTAEIGISPLKNATSAIFSDSAKEEHMGYYQCAPGNETFQLLIKSAIKYKVLTADTLPVQLNCENRTEGDKVIWTINDKPSAEFLKDRSQFVTINEKNGTLSINAVKNASAKYVCDIVGVANASTIFKVVEKPYPLKLDPSYTVVEGEKLTIHCTADYHGSGLKVKWLFAGKNYTTDEGRVKLLPNGNVNTGKLVVENIGMDDRGNVSCYVAYDWNDIDNPHYAVNATTILRVKDKLAALWPFLGICAEVVVLCAIILIYEKKRNKSELEESDTDQSPDTKPPPTKDSDVRQRK